MYVLWDYLVFWFGIKFCFCVDVLCLLMIDLFEIDFWWGLVRCFFFVRWWVFYLKLMLFCFCLMFWVCWLVSWFFFWWYVGRWVLYFWEFGVGGLFCINRFCVVVFIGRFLGLLWVRWRWVIVIVLCFWCVLNYFIFWMFGCVDF